MRQVRSIVCWGVIAIMVVSSVGCQTMGEHRTATGAATGGAVGAGAGALIDKDHPERGALIGAAVGALLGAGVGHMLQKQKQAFERIESVEAQQETVILQQAAEEGEQPVEEQMPALRVTIQNEVLFPVGSSALSEAGTAKIAEVALVLKEYPDSDAFIRGYTSSEGNDKDNFDLSLRRAVVVKNELIANGVAEERLDARGMGSSTPIGDNATEAGRVQNRRVEIHIVPHGEPAA